MGTRLRIDRAKPVPFPLAAWCATGSWELCLYWSRGLRADSRRDKWVRRDLRL